MNYKKIIKIICYVFFILFCFEIWILFDNNILFKLSFKIVYRFWLHGVNVFQYRIDDSIPATHPHQLSSGDWYVLVGIWVESEA
jgi:hypothetical protein